MRATWGAWPGCLVYVIDSGGWIGWGGRLCADFLVPVLDLYNFKRLQIAVICVYLRKISEYEED